MKRFFNVFIASILFFPTLASCLESSTSKEEIRSFLKNIFQDNASYMSELSQAHFKSFSEKQTPRATVLSCSDSRVQVNAFHKNPVNDFFVVRNIGNQIKTTEGSIEFGVNHLHTPFLLIVGHSNCGAIHTALGNYSREAKALRVELDHLHLSPKIETNEGVIENVNNQVAYAIEKFKEKIAKKELVVLGTLYDFRDDFNQGHGRLILINLNGEKDPSKIKEHEYIKGLENFSIGVEHAEQKSKQPAS